MSDGLGLPGCPAVGACPCTFVPGLPPGEALGLTLVPPCCPPSPRATRKAVFVVVSSTEKKNVGSCGVRIVRM